MDAVAHSAQKSRQLYINNILIILIYMHIIVCVHIYIYTWFSWCVHVATRDQIGSNSGLI